MKNRREFLFTSISAAGCSMSSHQEKFKSSRAEWMRGRWGIMVHWVLPGPEPESGSRDLDINSSTMKFKIEYFVNQIKYSGASWIIFTIGQNTGFYNSPSVILDRLVGPGHCSKFDLILHLAKAVKRAGIKFIAYMPGEMEQVPSLQHAFYWGRSKQKFEEIYTQLLAEYGRRLGMLCDGWWIDGCYDHLWLANSERNWPLWLSRLREGNPKRAIAFNDGAFLGGIAKALTPDQDFLSGECFGIADEGPIIGRGTTAASLTDAVKLNDRCVPHVLVPIDDGGQWVHTSPQPIGPVIFDRMRLMTFLKNCQKSGFAATFNVGIYQEGFISNNTCEILRNL